MRFEEYLLLEKITKKEMKDVFNNSNILIGAEFEFIADELKERTGTEEIEEEHEEAMRDYRQWKRDYEEWQREITELEAQIEDAEEKVRELEEDLDNAEDDDERERLAKEIDEKQDTVDDLKNDLADLKEPRNKPEIGISYVEYMNKVDPGWGARSLPPEPPDPEEIGVTGLDDEDTWKEIAKDVLPSIIRTANFVEDYEIAGYGDVIQTQENQVWAFEYDSSVSGYGGVEMKSPPMPLPDFVDILPEILNWINDYGSTMSETGLHFHMSMQGQNKMEVDMVKLILFTDEGLIWKYFPERVNNEYAKEVKNRILKGMDPQQMKSYINDLSGLKEIPDDKIKEIKGEHYDAVRQVGTKGTHVEFRHPGGQGYHRKLSEIKRLIGNYAFTLSVAVDPEYKYKEYVRKVIRIFNKIEKYILKEKLNYLTSDDGVKADLDRMKRLNKIGEREVELINKFVERRKKEVKQQLKNLNVTLTSKEEKLISKIALEGQDSELKKIYNVVRRGKIK